MRGRAVAGALRAALLLAGAAGASGGCAWMYPTAVPLRTQSYPAAAGRGGGTLLILLPGRGDKAEAFAAHGFVSDVQAQRPDVDVLAVDAHLGYYMRETIVDRLWTDVIAPARQRGYRHIWLGGISMGGLGAVATARLHAEALERVILLAPYLGPESLLRQIAAAGGPARWTPTDPGDPYQRLWQWLQGHGGRAQEPALALGFGTGDRLAPGHRLLAQLLPPAQVLEGNGGHDWTTWRQIWRRLWSPSSIGGSDRRDSVLLEDSRGERNR